MTESPYLWKLSWLKFDMQTERSRIKATYDERYEDRDSETEMTIVTWE